MTTILVWLFMIAVALAGLHRFALWAERRGWIFYKHTKAFPGTAGRAFMEVQSLLEPAVKHVIKAEREMAAEEDHLGDPPSPSARPFARS